jgi:alanine dehydrogenase
MILGIPKEIKEEELRVAITPAGASAFVAHGHKVLVERGAGVGSGILDREYREAGVTIVDIAVDQGGVCETTRPTTHDNPIYINHEVVHYCVSNMPGAVPRTSTYALTNSTLSYALELADHGLEKSMAHNTALLKGLNIYRGKVTLRAVAEAFGMDCEEPRF